MNICNKTIYRIKRISAVTLLLMVFMTGRLWLPGSAWAVPLFNSLWMPTVLLWGISICFVAWIVYSVLFPQGWLQGLILLLLLALEVVMDLNRWQVWLFHFAFVAMLPDTLEDREVAPVIAFMAGVTYVLSGLGKFNLAFGEEILPWLLEPFRVPVWPPLAWIIPGIELLAGLMLFVPNFRPFAATSAIVMHFVIVLVLIYHGWNYTVIPWNLALIVCHGWIITSRGHWMPFTVKLAPLVLLIVVVPALSWVGIIHRGFSLSMYSGVQLSGIVLCSADFTRRLPVDARALAQKVEETHENYVNLDKLAQARIGVPLFQDMRCYKALVSDILELARDRDDLVVLIRDGQGFSKDRSHFLVFTPADLKPSDYGR